MNYQTQQLVEAMVAMMVMAMGVGMVMPVILQRSPTELSDSKTITIPEIAEFYHGTPKSNLKSILRDGIKPRTSEQCEHMIDNLLAEYNHTRSDLPDWTWKYPLARCQETVGRVYLSGNRKYALANSQAGKEVEADMRKNIIAHDRGGSLAPGERHKIISQAYEPYSALLKVRIPTSWINQLNDLKKRIPLVIRHYPYMSEYKAWKYLLEEVTVTVSEIPPEYIIGYRIVPFGIY